MQKRILILEDDPHIGFILELFLSSQGFQVGLCTTIAELKQESGRELPDVFLLDIMVPDGNGLSFCKMIKQDPHSRQIPVVMMSAHLPVENVSQEACNDDFIAKPFDLDTLAKMISKHVS